MTRWSRVVAAGLVAVAVLAAVALASPLGQGGLGIAAGGPGTMGSGGTGMMGGQSAQTLGGSRPSTLVAVRDQVERWLRARGLGSYRVSEVMAFANNDYVAVRDARGRPAFEVLAARNLSWWMEEPPSMMWNTRFGMMRGVGPGWSSTGSMMSGMRGAMNDWYGSGRGAVGSLRAAARAADAWLARARPGEKVDRDVEGMGRFPGYYTLDTVRNGETTGMISVNSSTGAVWYHGWHGRFLREREF